MLNELVVNAVKYAFREGDSGRIEILLKKKGLGRGELTIQDNGIGLPEEINPDTAAGFGLTLVHNLVAQIHGSLEVERGGGTTFRIIF